MLTIRGENGTFGSWTPKRHPSNTTPRFHPTQPPRPPPNIATVASAARHGRPAANVPDAVHVVPEHLEVGDLLELPVPIRGPAVIPQRLFDCIELAVVPAPRLVNLPERRSAGASAGRHVDGYYGSCWGGRGRGLKPGKRHSNHLGSRSSHQQGTERAGHRIGTFAYDPWPSSSSTSKH